MSTPYPADGEHSVHALGITALLCPSSSPLEMMSDVAAGTLDSLMRCGLLSPPSIGTSEPNIDTLSRELSPLFDHADTLLVQTDAASRNLSQVRALCIDARNAFYKMRWWEQTQTSLPPAQFGGIAEGSLAEREHGRVFWPGRVDVYRDCTYFLEIS
jgi:hypothetical protein